jgi:phosphotransferase system HPr (HPr) family protein
MSTTLKRDMTVDSEHGLHLRAAAMLARTAKEFLADISVCHGRKTVNAKSTVGLMTLGTPQSGAITVEACGSDAPSALDAIQELLRAERFVHQSVA